MWQSEKIRRNRVFIGGLGGYVLLYGSCCQVCADERCQNYVDCVVHVEIKAIGADSYLHQST